MSRRIAFYVRVSTTTTQTTDLQRSALRQWARSQGLNSNRYEWFEDRLSGTTNDRPSLLRMLEAVKRKRIQTVVVSKLDRLARSLKGGLEVLESLTEAGCRIVSVSQNLDMMSGPVGTLVRNLIMAVSEFEVETRRDRVKAGVVAYRERVGTWGRPKNHTRYDKVKGMRDRGMSVPQIASRLKVTRQAIYYLLKAS